MRKISVNCLLIIAFFVLPFAPARASAPLPPEQMARAECFDFYKYGEYSVDLSADYTKAVSGVEFNARATVGNPTNFPLVDASVYIKVYNKQTNEELARQHGHQLVDQFFAAEKLYIGPNSNKVLDIKWSIPVYAQSGDYLMVAFLTASKKTNLAGLNFTDDIFGSSLEFFVSAQTDQAVSFNKDNVFLNGEKYYFAAFNPEFANGVVTVRAELVNNTLARKNIPVTWTLYNWDGLRGENFIRESVQNVAIEAGQKTMLDYAVPEADFPVYYITAKADYFDASSIINIRFIRNQVDGVRISSPLVMSFPLKKGEKNSLVACVHGSGKSDTVGGNLLKVSLTSDDGQLIHQASYEGVITGSMMGLKSDFFPDKNYDNFILRAELSRDGNKADVVAINYKCADINPAFCADDSQQAGFPGFAKWLVALGGMILILVLARFVRKNKNSSSIKGVFGVLLFVLVGTLFVLTPVNDALALTNTATINKTFSKLYYQDDPAMPNLGLALENPNINIIYRATVNYCNGDPINSGETVLVGKNLCFSFEREHPSWSGTGYAWDTPSGRWEPNAAEVGRGCQRSDRIGLEKANDADADIWFWVYVKLSVDNSNLPKPTNNRPASGVLTNKVSAYQYEISAPGQVNVDMHFPSTYGKFWYSRLLEGSSDCEEYSDALFYLSGGDKKYRNQFPSRKINFKLTAVNPPLANQPPAPPVIGGPTKGYTSQNYNFTFTASDPDNDKIYYEIDWLNDGNYQRAPSAGYVNSGQLQVRDYSWITQDQKTIKARACDEHGACSSQSSHAISILSKKTLDKEICDNIDNNGDGEIDEGFDNLGDFCLNGLGSCSSEGVFVCTADGADTVCNAIPESPSLEICGNGIDEDCDGSDLSCFSETGKKPWWHEVLPRIFNSIGKAFDSALKAVILFIK